MKQSLSLRKKSKYQRPNAPLSQPRALNEITAVAQRPPDKELLLLSRMLLEQVRLSLSVIEDCKERNKIEMTKRLDMKQT